MKGRADNLSVIIVVKNGELYIAQAMRSILKQTLLPAEILVIDGQSTDRTLEITKNFSWVYSPIHCLQQSSHGLANARNFGIEQAQGDLIAFLDHDDLWHPKKLEYQVCCLQNNKSIQFTVCYLKMFRQLGKNKRLNFPDSYLAKNHLGLTPSALVARRSAFTQIGYFDPNLQIGCDSEWFARAYDHHLSFGILPLTLVYKRIHSSNTSATLDIYKEELFQLIRKSIHRKR